VGRVYAKGIIAGEICGGSFCLQCLDKRCPSHPYICHFAKFEQNRTIGGRAIAIKLIRFDRRPPSWIFQAGVREPHHTLWDLIFYLHIKFGEDTFIGAENLSLKRNSKKRSLAVEF